MRTVLLIASAALLAAGCASQETGDTAAKTEQATATAETPDAVPALATITGTMGCGHCTFSTTDTCAPALQTDEGVVWILEGVGEDSELFENRYDLGMVQVTGTKRAESGTHYLQVDSYVPVTAETRGEEG